MYEGKRLLVIGGSSGIGLATAQAAAAGGAAVTIASRSPEKLATAAKAIGRTVGMLPLDVTDEQGLATALSRAGEFDWLVTTAAEAAMGAFKELPVDKAKAAMESKFWGQYRAVRAARLSSSGAVVMVSGLWAERPTPGAAHIAAVNGAIEALGRALAMELAPVRVNVVSPGIIDTPVWAGMPAADRERLFAQVAAAVPARRIGQPEDVAGAILFLLANPNMSGEVLHVNGGARLV